MTHLIKSTKNYTLSVGTSSQTNSICYQIINKKFGVIEIETFLLAQALKYMNEMEAALDAQTDIFETE